MRTVTNRLEYELVCIEYEYSMHTRVVLASMHNTRVLVWILRLACILLSILLLLLYYFLEYYGYSCMHAS